MNAGSIDADAYKRIPSASKETAENFSAQRFIMKFFLIQHNMKVLLINDQFDI